MVVIDQDKTEKIRQVLRGHPRGLTITDLTVRVNMNRNVTAKYLDMLLVSGQVEMQLIGPSKVYTLSHRVPISAMLEFSSDYIIVSDGERRIVQVNEPLLQLLNVHRDALVGKTIAEIDIPLISSLPLLEPEDGNHSSAKAGEISVHDGKTIHFRMKPVPSVFEDGKQGMTYIIEDITEKKEAAEEIGRHIKRMEFFSKILQEFIELPLESNIYEKIGNDLNSLIPGALISVHSFDDAKGVARVQYMTGIEDDRSVLGKCFDRDPVGLDISIDQIALDGLRTGKLLFAPLNSHSFSFDTLSESQFGKVARRLKLGDTAYGIGFVRHNRIFGATSIFPRKGTIIADTLLVETYAHAASIALQRYMAEKALERSEQLYRGLAEKICGAYYRTDLDGNLIMASSSWAGILGYDSVDECIGRNIADTWYMVPAQRKVFLDTIHKDGAVRNYEVLLKRKDGTPQPFEVTSQLYFDEKGAVLGVEGFFREIAAPQEERT